MSFVFFLPMVVCPSVFALHSAPPSAWRARHHQSSIITITINDDNQYKQITINDDNQYEQITNSNNEKLVHSSFHMKSQILKEKERKRNQEAGQFFFCFLQYWNLSLKFFQEMRTVLNQSQINSNRDAMMGTFAQVFTKQL